MTLIYKKELEPLPTTSPIVWYAVCAFISLIGAVFCAASEYILMGLSSSQQTSLSSSNSLTAKRAHTLIESGTRLHYTLIIAQNIFNGCAIAAILLYAGHWSIWVQILLVATLLLLNELLIPHRYIREHALELAPRVALPISLLHFILTPLTWFFTKVNSTNPLEHQGATSIEEIEEAIEEMNAGSTGELTEDQTMLQGVVRFGDKEVDQVMKSRIDVVAIETQATYAEVKQTFVDSGFSRIPVYSNSSDNIVGVLYLKDLLPHIEEPDDFQWQTLMREAYFVPNTKKLDALLRDFRRKKNHLAIVVDEYGGTLGIATMEDVLEEIVGEIDDESDVNEDCFEQIDDLTYIFDGRTHIGDFLRTLNLPDTLLDEVRGEADTLAGLMLEIEGEFLEQGQSVNFDNITFTALEIQGRRISKIKVATQNCDAATNE